MKKQRRKPLFETHPKHSEEWHPTKNGDLSPSEVTHASTRLVWWQCAYGHEWQSKVVNKTRASGCPTCRAKSDQHSRILSSSYNLVVCNPEIAFEWHQDRNRNLKPTCVTPGSSRKVWWQCKKGHIWLAAISNRVKGTRCPYCANKLVSSDNNLAILYPSISREWHPTNNGCLKPSDVVPGTPKLVWWICERGHDWQAQVRNRVNLGNRCPVCFGKAVSPEISLHHLNPALSREWHTKKNKITPLDVRPQSNKKVWWICNEGHEWQARVADRNNGDGCPYCSGARLSSTNNLHATYPNVAREWHPTKNVEKPSEVMPGTHTKFWWICKYGHEWQASPLNRTIGGTSCPECNIQSSRLELRIYCELCAVFTEVKWRESIDGAECDVYLPEMHVGIEVDGVYWHRGKLEKDRAKTYLFKQLGITTIRLRERPLKKTSKNDILFTTDQDHLSVVKSLLAKINDTAIIDEEDLHSINKYLVGHRFRNETQYRKTLSQLPGPSYSKSVEALYPNLVSEWNWRKNQHLTPKMFSKGSSQKVWWLCHKGHEWKTDIKSRVRGNSCPYCSGRRVGYGNSLADVDPALVGEWHPTMNGDLSPKQIRPQSHKKVWWRCKRGHEWQAIVQGRFKRGYGCPYCSGYRVSGDFNLSRTNPEIAAEWHPSKNGTFNPSDVTPSSKRNAWWKCSYNHEWQARICDRTQGSVCPQCKGSKKTSTLDS